MLYGIIRVGVSFGFFDFLVFFPIYHHQKLMSLKYVVEGAARFINV